MPFRGGLQPAIFFSASVAKCRTEERRHTSSERPRMKANCADREVSVLRTPISPANRNRRAAVPFGRLEHLKRKDCRAAGLPPVAALR